MGVVQITNQKSTHSKKKLHKNQS